MDFPGFTLDLTGVEKTRRPDPAETYDVLILGGGPAAMTALVYAARKLLKVALVTAEFGGQVGETSAIENYMGFQTITGKELVARFKEQVQGFDVPVAEGERVERVRLEGGLFEVATAGGAVFRGRTVIYATGKRSRRLNVPGEAELAGKGVAYCATCDAPFFKGKRVVVAGGGNSALTAVVDLLKVATEVTAVNFVEGWQADPVLLEAARRHGHLRLLDLHAVKAIEGRERVEAVRVEDRRTGEERLLAAEGVFVEIGLLPNTDPVRGLAALNPAGELLVDCHCRTDVEGLFGAGDATTVPYKQIIISAGEGAKAALAAYDLLTSRGLV